QLGNATAGQVIKANAGTLVHGQAAVDYPGIASTATLDINAGLVNLINNNAFGSAVTNTITLNGGTLTVNYFGTAPVASFPNGLIYNSGTYNDINAANSSTKWGALTVAPGATFAPVTVG